MDSDGGGWMKKRLQIGFLIDPIDTLDVKGDTSIVLMQEAQRRGHRVFTFTLQQLFLENGVPYGELYPIRMTGRPTFYRLGPKRVVPLHKLDILFMRKDPPVDQNYFTATFILERIPPPTLVINDPAGLRNANEKLFSLRFPKWIPEHIVSSDPKEILRFMNDVGGEIVIKPVYGFGGREVFYLNQKDKNKHALLEAMTEEGTLQINAQKYIPQARQGDKRIIVLDGRPIGALLRIPPPDDHRGNLHIGGKGAKAPLTRRDHEICEALKPVLQEQGLYLVGLDVIGGYLTEVNVTSPTGVQQIDRLYRARLEEQVIHFAERAYSERL